MPRLGTIFRGTAHFVVHRVLPVEGGTWKFGGGPVDVTKQAAINKQTDDVG